jgi:hypothetical protein
MPPSYYPGRGSETRPPTSPQSTMGCTLHDILPRSASRSNPGTSSPSLLGFVATNLEQVYLVERWQTLLFVFPSIGRFGKCLPSVPPTARLIVPALPR